MEKSGGGGAKVVGTRDWGHRRLRSNGWRNDDNLRKGSGVNRELVLECIGYAEHALTSGDLPVRSNRPLRQIAKHERHRDASKSTTPIHRSVTWRGWGDEASSKLRRPKVFVESQRGPRVVPTLVPPSEAIPNNNSI